MEITDTMHIKRCNGCQADLETEDWVGKRKRTCVEGRRVDGLSGSFDGQLLRNQEEFHWCFECTRVAFMAVSSAAAARG